MASICSICQEDAVSDVIALPVCGHLFHRGCLDEHIRRIRTDRHATRSECPNCRGDLCRGGYRQYLAARELFRRHITADADRLPQLTDEEENPRAAGWELELAAEFASARRLSADLLTTADGVSRLVLSAFVFEWMTCLATGHTARADAVCDEYMATTAGATETAPVFDRMIALYYLRVSDLHRAERFVRRGETTTTGGGLHVHSSCLLRPLAPRVHTSAPPPLTAVLRPNPSRPLGQPMRPTPTLCIGRWSS
jgi:hypothetical protein